MIATNLAFLHAKIYRFIGSGDHKRYLVGSANFSLPGFARNDEILLLESGTHVGIDDYIEYIRKNSSGIELVDASLEADITDIINFCREAYLFFRPSRNIPYTVDCFSGELFSASRKRLERATVGRALLGHDSATIGALNVATLMNVPSGQESRRNVPSASFGIETAFGLWIPTAYLPQFEEKIESSSRGRHQELEAQGLALKNLTIDEINHRIKKYIDEADDLLGDDLKFSLTQRSAIQERIHNATKRLTDVLSNEESIKRLSCSLHGAPMPEFWEDERSVEEFIKSFTDYLEYRIRKDSIGKRPRRMILHICEQFGLNGGDEANDIRKKIQLFFGEGKSWPITNWPGVNPEAEPDDDD